jgi:hypothetical protein
MPESLEVVAARELGEMATHDVAEYLGVTCQRVYQMLNQLPAPRG